MTEVMVIDCDECVMQHTSACDDCVVSALCGREADQTLVLDGAEAQVLRLLSTAGLVPVLRHQRLD
jgi:hypothetical protein